MALSVGKFVKSEWINGDYRSTWLRRINRETSTQFISDVQRYFRNFEDGVDDRVFVGKWATRYNKKSDGSFVTRLSHRSNPDGHYRLTIVDIEKDTSPLLCTKTYSELFMSDLRVIQHEKTYPRQSKERRHADLVKNKNTDRLATFDWTLEQYLHAENSAGHWNEPLIRWLEDTFKVPVFYLYEKVNEHSHQGILERTGTTMHINHFGGEKKRITFNENYHNRTIMFWLFEDRLVYQYEDGRDSH